MCGRIDSQKRYLVSVTLASNEVATTATTRNWDADALVKPDASIGMFFSVLE